MKKSCYLLSFRTCYRKHLPTLTNSNKYLDSNEHNKILPHHNWEIHFIPSLKHCKHGWINILNVTEINQMVETKYKQVG